MKTRREVLVDAGVPEAELALVDDPDLDEPASEANKDYPDLALALSFSHRHTEQGEEYWEQWARHLFDSRQPCPGPSGKAKEIDMSDDSIERLRHYLEVTEDCAKDLRERLAAAEENAASLREQLAAAERWQPEGGPWYITASGKVYRFAPGDEERRRAGAEAKTPEDAARRAEENVARQILDAWVSENGERGNWLVGQGEDGEWFASTVYSYYPGPVMMSKDTAYRAVAALNEGTLILEP